MKIKVELSMKEAASIYSAFDIYVNLFAGSARGYLAIEQRDAIFRVMITAVNKAKNKAKRDRLINRKVKRIKNKK